jgi:hypothetical protein
MKRFLILGLLAATSAFAEETRKVDFTQPIMSDGATVIDDMKCPVDKDGKRPCETPITLGEFAFRSLRAPAKVPLDELIERDDLANGVRRATDWPLLPKQRDLILRVMAENFPFPAVVAPAAKMLGK